MPIFVYLLAAGAFAYGLLRFVYYRAPELFICFIVIINFDFFYLLPPVGGFYNYAVTLLPIICLLIAEQLLRGQIRLDGFGALVLAYLFLLVVAVVAAYGNGQSLLLGVKAIKYQVLILVYFIVASRDIKLDRFVKYFIVISVLLMLLADVDTVFFNGKFIFARASERYMGERLDRTRFVLGSVMISIACAMAFAAFVKKKSRGYAVVFFVMFVHVFVIIQTRMMILGLILTCVMLLLVFRKVSPSGVFILVFLSLLYIPGVMLFGSLFDEIGLIQKTRSDIANKTGSWQGRVNAYTFYWDRIAASPVLGYGYENSNWEKSTEMRANQQHMYLTDIGITHLFYRHGMLGMIWFLAFFLMVVRAGRSIHKRVPEIISYFYIGFITMATLDFFFHQQSILLLGLFLGLLAQQFAKQRHAAPAEG